VKCSSANDSSGLEVKSKERFVHVYVTMLHEKTQYPQSANFYKFCPKNSDNRLVYRINYGKLEDLFPQAVMFNTKCTLNSNLRNLSDQIPEILQHQQEIDDEIRHIFPFVSIGSISEVSNSNL
jgi:hypothetical protein